MIDTIRSGVNAHRFWGWFAGEAAGYRNALEALRRGEADGAATFNRLDRRVSRIGDRIQAVVDIAPDGGCRIVFSGREQDVRRVLKAARRVPGWSVGYGEVEPAPVRAARVKSRPVGQRALRRAFAS
jgi:hypothetical protein